MVRGRFYEVTKHEICLKIYCDIFLKGVVIIIKRLESSRCLILKGPGYFQGTTIIVVPILVVVPMLVVN